MRFFLPPDFPERVETVPIEIVDGMARNQVYLLEYVGRGTDMGRLGQEKHVLGMMVLNGCSIKVTHFCADGYTYNSGGGWLLWLRLNHTLGVEYRRAWNLAEVSGEVFCSTLPSGMV